ncbi:MAG TPA: SRPBCC domain-containing protein [Polyangiales bacterium]|nr:SRPBCC domain-containing protein [Polyangiales bacterium]
MATHELRTEIEIAAPPAKVWAILTDFAAYPSWNPFVVSLEGALAQGAPLVARMRPPGSARAMTFKPHVTALEAEKRFAWFGTLPIPGLFGGEHGFELIALGPDRVRFVHGEKFRGLLIPLLRKSLDGATRAGFVAMNEALKKRAEAAL